MEVRGIAGGVTVIDDFGHHPTAVHETLRALRQRYSREKIRAIFAPRTNTTRRNVFQTEFAASFADATTSRFHKWRVWSNSVLRSG
jgi:UDP-N-acetylmuramate: L-alanyl-gamma-D-glutamyl-meso-diaminopimelate ligase